MVEVLGVDLSGNLLILINEMVSFLLESNPFLAEGDKLFPEVSDFLLQSFLIFLVLLDHDFLLGFSFLQEVIPCFILVLSLDRLSLLI